MSEEKAEKVKGLIFKSAKDELSEGLKELKKTAKKVGWSKEKLADEIEAIKQGGNKKESFSFKLPPADAEMFAAYASLAIDEKVAQGKTLKAVKGEITAFAVIKLMKADKYLNEKFEAGYRAPKDEKKKKKEGK